MTYIEQIRYTKSTQFGQEKTNKHKHFRRDGLRDKQELSLGQMGPFPGQNGTCPWDKPAFLCLIPQ